MLVRLILVLAALSATSACASVSSRSVSDARARGVVYSLPTVAFNLTLRGVTDGNNFDSNVILAVEPEYTVDTAAGALALDYSPGFLSQDTVNIDVDGRGLLLSVSGQFNSRAIQTLTGVGRAFGLTESGEGVQYEISSDVVDPSDPAQLSASAVVLTRAMQDWAARQYDGLGSESAPQRRRLYRAAFVTSFGLEWRWHGDGAPTAPRVSPPRAAAACGGGVCARPLRRGRLIVWRCGPVAPPARLNPATAPPPNPQDCNYTNGVQISATALSIPNNAPSVSVPVNGGLFADRTRSIAFVNGMVVDYDATGGSEGEGLFNGIGALAVAIPAGAVERVRGETSVVREQATLVNQQTALVRAQQGYQAAIAGTSQGGEAEAPSEPQTQTSEEPSEAGDAESGDAIGEVETPPAPPAQPNANSQPVATARDMVLEAWAVPLFGALPGLRAEH